MRLSSTKALRLGREDLFFNAAVSKALIKAINTTTAINGLLLAGIKGVAIGAYIQVDAVALGRTYFNNITTTASGG